MRYIFALHIVYCSIDCLISVFIQCTKTISIFFVLWWIFCFSFFFFFFITFSSKFLHGPCVTEWEKGTLIFYLFRSIYYSLALSTFTLQYPIYSHTYIRQINNNFLFHLDCRNCCCCFCPCASIFPRISLIWKMNPPFIISAFDCINYPMIDRYHIFVKPKESHFLLHTHKHTDSLSFPPFLIHSIFLFHSYIVFKTEFVCFFSCLF